MGILDKVFGGDKAEQDINLEDLLSGEGDVVSPPADHYVKKIDLRNEGDVQKVAKELKESNIILLNIYPLSKQPNRLSKIVGALKEYVYKVDGDIARLPTKAGDFIILTPKSIRIVKPKGKS